MENKDKLVNRFLKYISINTTSCTNSTSIPSTSSQLVLANLIKDELLLMGLKNIQLSKHGVLYAKLPGTLPNKIGLIAHFDTSSDAKGTNIKPKIIKNYDGGNIELNPTMEMTPLMFPSLLNHVTHDLIVTDGETLLGADDKAGIAEIMCVLDYFINNPTIEHNEICIAFTPDEEIGLGTANFDTKLFGADFAYTIDGSDISKLEIANFNASHISVNIEGLSIHPGYSYHKMINASLLASEFIMMLPQDDTPYHSKENKGFIHVCSINSKCEKANIELIIRDFDLKLIEQRKELIINIANHINTKYNKNLVTLNINNTYFNMQDNLAKHPKVYEFAFECMNQLGMNPSYSKIRGGTDGANLTNMGLPCPNIGTGGFNFHGNYEYISINNMHKVVDLLTKIIKEY